MSFETIIKAAESKFIVDHEARRKYFDELVSASVAPCESLTPKRLARFLDSFRSVDKLTCEPSQFSCVKHEERGYPPFHVPPQLLSVLLESYSLNKSKFGSVHAAMIKTALRSVYEMVLLREDVFVNGVAKHEINVINKLKALGEGTSLSYHSGYSGHSIYLDWVGAGAKGVYCNIYNLGEGRNLYHNPKDYWHNGELVRSEIKPFRLFIPRDRIEQHVADVVSCLQGIRPKDEKAGAAFAKVKLKRLYESGDKLTSPELIEYGQNTGNCVIKNCLFAIRGRLDNDNAYKHIYTLMFGVLAGHHIFLDGGVAGLQDVTAIARESCKLQYTLRHTDPCDFLSEIKFFISPDYIESKDSVSKTGKKTKARMPVAAAGFAGVAVGIPIAAVFSVLIWHSVDSLMHKKLSASMQTLYIILLVASIIGLMAVSPAAGYAVYDDCSKARPEKEPKICNLSMASNECHFLNSGVSSGHDNMQQFIDFALGSVG